MKRKLNGKFLAALSAIVVAGGAGIHTLHTRQVRRTADFLIDRAAVEEREKRDDEAAGALRHYLALRPDDVDVLVRLVTILERSARSPAERGQILAAFERVLRKDPGRIDVRRRLVRLAMADDLRRFEAARPHLRILLANQPTDGEWEGYLGRCEEEAARYAEAASYYQKAIAHAPGRTEAYERLALLLRDRLNEPDEAGRVLDALVSENAKSFRAHLIRAEFRARSAPGEAAADIARAKALAPDEADVILASALIATDAADARAGLRRGLVLFPHDARMYRRMASLELRLGQTDAALAVLDEGLKVLPGESDLRLSRLDVLAQIGRTSEVVEGAARLRQEGYPPAPLSLLEARLAIRDERWRDAATVLERLLPTLELLPSTARRELSIEANLRLADCYDRLGQPELRLTAYRHVLAADPRNRRAREGRASALLQLNRTGEAILALRELTPESPEAGLELTRVLIEQNRGRPEADRRWQQAEDALAMAERASPGSLPCALLRAELLLGRGDSTGAETCLVQATANHPDRAEPWLARVSLAEKAAGPESALRVLDEAVERSGDRLEYRLARAGVLGRHDSPQARQTLDQLAEKLDGFTADDRLRLLEGLAQIRQRAGDPEGAKRLWRRVSESGTRNAVALAHLFELALAAGETAEAERLNEAIRRVEGPEGTMWRCAEAALALARARVDQAREGDLAAARSRLAEAAARRPTLPLIASLEAEIAEHMGETDRAIAAYRRAFNLGDRSPRAVARLAELLVASGEASEASGVLQRSLEGVPPAGPLARAQAELALSNGDPAGARAAARAAVRMEDGGVADLIWLGEFLERAGVASEAEPIFREAVRRGGDQPEPWLALVRYLARSGRGDEAMRAARDAEEALPPSRAYPALAICLEAAGSMEEAEARHRNTLNAAPRDGSVLLAYGEFLLRAGRPLDATPILRRALASNGLRATQMGRARRALAGSLIGRRGYQGFREAMALLDENLKHSGTIEDYRARALALATQPSEAAEATRAFERLARMRPLARDEQLLVARLRGTEGSWTAAAAGLRDLAKARPGDPQPLAALVEAILGQRDPAAARPWLEKLAALEPDSYRVAELRARLLDAEGKRTEAVSHLLEQSPKPDAPRARIAGWLETWDRPDEAERLYREAALHPTRAEDRLALARFLARRDRPTEALVAAATAWDDGLAQAVADTCVEIMAAKSAGPDDDRRAIEQLDAAIRKAADPSSLEIRAAMIHDRRGRPVEAESLYRRVLARDPRNAVALNNLAWSIALRGGRGKEALALVDRAASLVGQPADLLDTRAIAHLAMDRPDLAIRDLEKSLASRPTPSGYFHLSRAQAMAKRYDDARQALRRSLDMGLDPATLSVAERELYQTLSRELAGEGPPPPRPSDAASSRLNPTASRR